MGRGRGKGKKSLNGSDETGSGPEEIIPIQKRRGRPHKPLKDESDETELEDETLTTEADSAQKDKQEGSDAKPNLNLISTKEAEKNAKKKRKKQGGIVKEERENGSEVTGRVNGFRQSNHRRKSTPRRAAEAGIQCDW